MELIITCLILCTVNKNVSHIFIACLILGNSVSIGELIYLLHAYFYVR